MVGEDRLKRAIVGPETRPFAATVIALALVGAGGARAQVLAIGDDGAITTFEGPAVYSNGGATVFGRVDRPVPGSRTKPDVAEALDRAASRHRLQPDLLAAVARQESGLRQDARSPKGAIGVMQLMPGTAKSLGVDPLDVNGNIEGGAAYLASLLGRYGGNVRTALAAYNAGPAAVARYGGAPPFAETRAYVAAVMADWAIALRRAGETGMAQ